MSQWDSSSGARRWTLHLIWLFPEVPCRCYHAKRARTLQRSHRIAGLSWSILVSLSGFEIDKGSAMIYWSWGPVYADPWNVEFLSSWPVALNRKSTFLCELLWLLRFQCLSLAGIVGKQRRALGPRVFQTIIIMCSEHPDKTNCFSLAIKCPLCCLIGGGVWKLLFILARSKSIVFLGCKLIL